MIGEEEADAGVQTVRWRVVVRQPAVSGLALIVIGGLGCGLGSRTEKRPSNVVLVMSDALRAASLPTYGHARDTAPFIDSLARRGLVFTNAYSHYSFTWPSLANLFTGVPYSTLVREAYFVRPRSAEPGGGLVSNNLTLAEILQANGVRTRGVSANPWICNLHGFGQGFESFHDCEAWKPGYWEGPFRKFKAEQVNEVASKFLDELAEEDSPWFLFLFYFDTHNPYIPPPEDRALFVQSDYPRRNRVRGDPLGPDGNRLKYRTPPLRDWFTEQDVQYLRSLYEGEIHHFDRAVRTLFVELGARGLLDETTVVIAADHGEALFERDYWGHGFLSRDEEQHVPLIVVPPGGDSHRKVIASPVTTTDIFHSVLRHFRATPSFILQPLPWVTDVMSGESWSSVVYSEGPGDAYILRDERHSFYRYLGIEERKLPLRVSNGDFLFDRELDPGETFNIFDAAPERAQAVRQRLLKAAPFWPDEAALHVTEPFDRADEQIQEQLRTLGYIE